MTKLILDEPKYGWFSLTIYESENRVETIDCSYSYVMDTPMDLLKAIIHSLETNLPFCIEMESEGKGAWLFTNSEYLDNSWLLTDGELFAFESIPYKEIAKAIFEWYNTYTEQIYDFYQVDKTVEPLLYKQYKEELETLVSKLKELIK